MKISKSLKDFKNTHKKGLNQVIYKSFNSNSKNEITNLINNFLSEKNRFIREDVHIFVL